MNELNLSGAGESDLPSRSLGATLSTPDNGESVEHSSSSASARRRDGGVTWRVVFVSLLLAAMFGFLVPIIDFQSMNTKLGAGHLPVGSIGVLLLLLLIVNPLLKRLSGKLTFTRNEVLTVYISTLFSALTPGMGSESLFVSHIIAPFYFATRENRWLSFLQPYLKPWFSPALWPNGHYGPAQNAAVSGWFNTLPSGASHIPWGAWIVPLGAWSSLVFASYLMLGSLSVMLRAQWGEYEALSFPLLRLPLEMTENTDSQGRADVRAFFSNPMMWGGFAIAVFIEGVNGLNVYFPDVPSIPLTFPLGSLFQDAPWNQMAPMQLIVWPIFAAITFLLSSEIALSLWLFLWIVQGEYIIAYFLGFPYGNLPPAVGHSGDGVARTFTAFQQVGAYLGYVGVLMWTAREHLRHIAARAFGRVKATPIEGEEALSYPVAFWLFVLSFAYMTAWSCAAGMRVDVALALWGLYLVTTIGLSRAVVEGGVMFINQGWVPLGTLAQLLGSGPGRWLATSSLVPGSFLQVTFFQDMRGFIMPSFLHGLKLAQDRRLAARRLWWLIMATTLLSMGVGLWVKVSMGYRSGGLTLHPWFATVAAKYPAQNVETLLRGGEPSASNWLWLAVGLAATVLMMVARSRFAWFPLHPLGYLLALTAPTQRAWFSFFLGWLCKVTITRFGGHEAYRKVVPLALGVILGEASMFLFWLAIDALQGRTGHGMLP